MGTQIAPATKPILRGYFHQEAFFTFLGACILLIARTSDAKAFWAIAVYSFGLLFLFGVSAIYHRPHWAPRPRALLRRFDHCAIFILIAGSFTPVCLLAFPDSGGERLLPWVWLAAGIGVLQSMRICGAQAGVNLNYHSREVVEKA